LSSLLDRQKNNLTWPCGQKELAPLVVVARIDSQLYEIPVANVELVYRKYINIGWQKIVQFIPGVM
jgi:hypothetical protein